MMPSARPQAAKVQHAGYFPFPAPDAAVSSSQEHVSMLPTNFLDLGVGKVEDVCVEETLVLNYWHFTSSKNYRTDVGFFVL